MILGLVLLCSIIPLREKTGNYDQYAEEQTWKLHYTTTRENWELRQGNRTAHMQSNYTTTRENWELRLKMALHQIGFHYTTTRENWELRHQVLGYC